MENPGNWDIWELNTSRFDWTTTAAAVTTTTTAAAESTTSAYIFLHHNHQHHSLYGGSGGDGSHVHPDPHLMCLKLGKRHYFEDAINGGLSIAKRGKSYYGGAVVAQQAAVEPRCQVEGCEVVLVNAKDYHRRHKVCEMHSKAPMVIVLGMEQRFCQQCSRFHCVGEFDESKRSCRRRLAGHNERRRKTSHVKNPPQGRALSLLSSKSDSWVYPADLSSRSSAALRELIAEHRAAILARQLMVDRDWNVHHQAIEDPSESQPVTNSLIPHHNQLLHNSHTWDRVDGNGAHLTLDLMQAASSSGYGLLAARGKTREEEDCLELWNSIDGENLV